MGVIQRERKLHGTTLVLLLVLGWLHHPQAGSSALVRFAGTLGVRISKQGIEEHWTARTAEWLYEVLVRAIGCMLSAKAGVKLTLRLDLVQGPMLQDGRSHESRSLVQSLPLAKGALWIADMGYFALVRLVQMSQAGISYLMPLKDGVVMWLEGKRADILSVLQAGGAEEQALRCTWEPPSRSTVASWRGGRARRRSNADTRRRMSMRASMGPPSVSANAIGHAGRS